MSATQPHPPANSPANLATNLFDRPLPPGYRDELRDLIAVQPPDPSRQTGSILLFQLGPLRLALPTRVASAVAPVLHIARIPHRSGTVLLGLVSFRGELLPCCSLARILDLATAQPAREDIPSSTNRTLILEESPGRLWAVPIDGVLGVRIVALEQTFAPASSPLAAQWLTGTFQDDAGLFHLLDHDVLFRQINLATA